jgi:hypothetical protein
MVPPRVATESETVLVNAAMVWGWCVSPAFSLLYTKDGQSTPYQSRPGSGNLLTRLRPLLQRVRLSTWAGCRKHTRS